MAVLLDITRCDRNLSYTPIVSICIRLGGRSAPFADRHHKFDGSGGISVYHTKETSDRYKRVVSCIGTLCTETQSTVRKGKKAGNLSSKFKDTCAF